MTQPTLLWPFSGRTAQVEALGSLLSGPDRRGVVVVGEVGVGKTALIQHVLRRVGDQTHVVHLRGSASLEGTSYGAFNVILSRHQGELSHPLRILSGIADAIRTMAAGRPVILFLDNAEFLDSHSAMAVAQLAAAGIVTPVAAVRDLTHAPELMRMWTDGGLERLDLEGLSPEECREMLAEALSGPISETVTMQLWGASSGNPMLLQALAEEQRDAGHLLQREGVWVCRDDLIEHGGRIAEVVDLGLGPLTAAQRSLLEMCALVGELPLWVATAVAGRDEMDQLEARRLVSIRLANGPVLAVGSRFLSEVIRDNVPPGRANRLLERLEGLTDDTGLTPNGRLAHTLWRLDCRRDADRGLALESARLANRAGDFETALRILDSLGNENGDPEVALVQLVALVGSGQENKARQLLVSLGDMQLDPRAQLELDLVTAELADHGGDHESAHRTIAAAKDRIGNVPEDADKAELRLRIELAEAELFAREGQHASSIPGLEQARKDLPGNGGEDSLRAESLLAEAMAVAGRNEEALQLAQTLLERHKRDGHPAEVLESAARGLSVVRLTAREWQVTDTVSEVEQSPEAAQGRIPSVIPSVAAGVMQVHCGRAAQALKTLRPLISQLRQFDPDGLVGIASAAAAYASCLCGDVEEGRQYLRMAQECRSVHSRAAWIFDCDRDYFLEMATASFTSKDVAAAKLLEQAEQHRLRGALTAELFAISGAVRLGESAAAEELATKASIVQGAFARLCEHYGKGLAGGDPDQLLLAAERAHLIGHDLFALDAALAAVSLAQVANDGPRTAAARARTQQYRAMLGPVGVQGESHTPLTAKETDIALRAVGGLTNRQIADELVVSVRTIESHLYQIYAKLHVSGRAELSDVLEVSCK
ncbi:helix-turn-helix transcriptional regulator [Arthrobacter sulfonylureivorans]|uniref:helix-turn-helix transcriptional regulator n=1 Tax=Arthrobacter sulfonylureivorans TaxID=2486855 RepID=UPI0039E39677